VAALEASLAKAETAKDRHPSVAAAKPKAAKKAVKQPAKKRAPAKAAKKRSA
jgi:hypothetical protein